ncbi:MAG TPA: transglutaminase family protein [Acidimicrobiales bacterium]|nr:transglutaminase family protein [Acidimicrobiales bacterium]
MRIKVGCEFAHKAAGPTPTIWQVRPRPDGPAALVSSAWTSTPPLPTTSYIDAFGNLCDRLMLPEGDSVVRFDAVAEVSGDPDPVGLDAPQVAVEALPDDALVYLLPTRFCLSDVLHDEAWELFGGTAPGWARVQAVSDWVHANVRFDYQNTSPVTTACDVWRSRTGVCRDFAHLAVTFCRALNIPARYAFGYLPDIGVPPPDDPMDFCAWMEVYLGDRWWTFDPRNNQRRIGRVLIGRGRDAVDVAMLTTYGATILESMTVWAAEA